MGIYWSLQTEEVWDQAKELGFLIGQEEYGMYPNEYLWIKKPDMRSTNHFLIFYLGE